MICTFKQRFTTLMATREFGERVSAARNGSPVLAVECETGGLLDELREGTSA
jgi:hypothetical protein